jgi:Cyclic nucleotide-binding domain
MIIGAPGNEAPILNPKPISMLVESLCRSASRVAVADKVTLYAQGEPGSALFLIRDGFVKTSHICEDGTEITMNLLKSGEIAGVFSEPSPREYDETARAIGATGAGARPAHRHGSQPAIGDLRCRIPSCIETVGSTAAVARIDATCRMAANRNPG